MNLKRVGYQALVRQFDVKAIPHFQTSFITDRGGRRTIQQVSGEVEEIYPKSYDSGPEIGHQLEFALKYEGVNLEILGSLFAKINVKEVIKYILSRKTGKHARRLWFLYEFITGKNINQIPDLTMGNYIDLLDSDQYYTAKAIPSRRHRVNNNLLGTLSFCPIVRKTPLLIGYEKKRLDQRAADLIAGYPEEVITRAIHYLYRKETKSSFQIEKEEADESRISRFITTLRTAGHFDFMGREEFVKLQNLIVDSRFADPDYRKNQNYIGESVGLDRQIIHYVSPRPIDVHSLMEGLTKSHKRMRTSEISPVIHATVISFGFVFIHPFEDGNGRIHRFLIHQILAARGFTPAGIIFPISATLLRKIRKYDETLEIFSRPLMSLLQYSLDDDGMMTVLQDTKKYYSSIDMTHFCEAIFAFLEETIDTELFSELNFLVNYDRTKKDLQRIVDMPDQKLDQFIKFCIQNGGRLSSTKRDKFFSMLNDTEIKQLETVVQKNMPSSP